MLPAVERTLVGMPALPRPIAPGAMLGAYSIIAHLARGGMANVWVARHHGARGFSKLVALKTILPEFAEDQAFQRMFLKVPEELRGFDVIPMATQAKPQASPPAVP